MNKETNILLDLKAENRNKIFNKILELGSASGPELAYELKLSRPTITQNVNALKEDGLVYECGTLGHTGGRRAKTYAVNGKSRVAIGLDITQNYITVVMIDLCGEIVYEKRIRKLFGLKDSYMRQLGELVKEAVQSNQVEERQVLGVGIAVPGLITEDYKTVFYGEILEFTGADVKEFGKYIPYPCRLYNDADAGGYAEISKRPELSDAFYISLSNNVGGAVLIDHKVYKGEGPRSGEIGHMTLVPDGKTCYCGKKGCMEAYCNARILSENTGGNLEKFFQQLAVGNEKYEEIWEEYLKYLSIAVNNTRMLFDCKIILGGYVGAYIEEYLPALKRKAASRNTFENNAEYLLACKVKKDALALGSALPFVHEFWKNI